LKYENYRDYDPRRVYLAESALLTVWAGLSSYQDDLVLIGGLVTKYLCGDLSATRSLPRPVTLDADIGIALGASAGSYGSLSWDLQAQGFSRATQAGGGSRYVKSIEGFSVPVDFLTEQPGSSAGTVIVDDIVADILPGVDRALAVARLVEIEGIDLHGALQRLTLRVCEAGPFLALKLRAFARRQQPKDAFDILYTLRHYDGGPKSATAQFHEEIAAANPAIPEAVACLRQHFSSERSAAAVKAAVFVHGTTSIEESEEARSSRLRLQQDVVDAGRMLLAAVDE